MLNRGVIYYLYNKNIVYLDYNIKSAESVKKHMPKLDITLCSPFKSDEIDSDCFDNFVVYDNKDIGDNWIFKMELLIKTPYDQTMFVDSDTYFCDSVVELYELLDRFDFVTTLEHQYAHEQKYLQGFPQINGGMFLWNNNDKMEWLFEEAIRFKTRKKRGSDQAALRHALYYSDVRYAIVPWEYNCHYHYPGYLCGKVKLLHAKSDDFERDEKLFNIKVYDKYPPFKRIFDSENIFYLKKRWPRSSAPTDIVKKIRYKKHVKYL